MGLEAGYSAVIGRYIPFSIPAWVSKGTIVAAVDAGLIVGILLIVTKQLLEGSSTFGQDVR